MRNASENDGKQSCIKSSPDDIMDGIFIQDIKYSIVR